MKSLSFVFSLVAAILLWQCSDSSDFQTENGLTYRFIQQNEAAPQPEVGNVLSLHFEYYYEPADSLLFSSNEIPGTFHIKLKPPSYEKGSIEAAMAKMHLGDSMECYIDAEKFYNQTRGETVLPAFITPGDQLLFRMKLLKIQTEEDFAQRQHTLHENQMKEEQQRLDNYLKIKGIETEPTLSGLYFIEEKAGTGKMAQPGKEVTVHYTGALLNGYEFDSSRERGEPFTFVLGRGDVIQGWDEGVSRMREGGRATLIIPSHLAYGKQGYEDIIAPYTTLIFDIELLSIEEN